MLTENGYEANPKKVRAIVNALVSTNITEVNLFWECHFYSSFIKNFATIAAPLYDLRKKDVSFVWSNNAFEIFISKINNKVVLSRFDSEATLIIEGTHMEPHEKN